MNFGNMPGSPAPMGQPTPMGAPTPMGQPAPMGQPTPMGQPAPMGGVISLSKGQKIDLSKAAPTLKRAMVGLGWDVNTRVGADFDLDASCFLLDANGRASGIQDFIFYNNLTGGNGSVVHQGDNLTGAGDGDDEQIFIDFDKVPQNIAKIAITVTIFDAETRRQTFGQVSNAFCRVVNADTGAETVRYDLSEDFSIETGIVVVEFYRHNGTWKMGAVGQGYKDGLAGLARSYGLNVG